MPDEQPKLFGLPRRTAIIAGIALVVVVFLAMRARGAAPPAPAGVPAPGEEEMLGAQEAVYAAGPGEQDAFASRLQALEIGQAEAEHQFSLGQLRRQERFEEEQAGLATQYNQIQAGIQDFFLGRRKKMPRGVHCPRGKPRIDPSTGEIYCREEQSRGFARDTLKGLTGQETVGGALGTIGRYYLETQGARTKERKKRNARRSRTTYYSI